jgi:hypothetical protein
VVEGTTFCGAFDKKKGVKLESSRREVKKTQDNMLEQEAIALISALPADSFIPPSNQDESLVYQDSSLSILEPNGENQNPKPTEETSKDKEDGVQSSSDDDDDRSGNFSLHSIYCLLHFLISTFVHAITFLFLFCFALLCLVFFFFFSNAVTANWPNTSNS